MSRINPTLLSMILLLGILSLSCRNNSDRQGSGSSGLIKDPTTDITGEWTGDWTTLHGASGDAGSLTMMIDQDADGVATGISQWLWTGDDPEKFNKPVDPLAPKRCWEESDVRGGIVSGNQVTNFTIVELLKNQPEIGLGRVIVIARFQVTGETMVGTFKVTTFDNSLSRCSTPITRLNNEGIISLTRIN